jgi:O-antigen ligase
LPFSAILSSAFTNHNFALPIAMHATFLSMQLAIALVFLLSQLLNSQKSYTKLIYAVCIAVLSGGLIQLSSKSVLIPLLIIVVIAVPYFLPARSKRVKYLLTASVFCALAAWGIFSIGTFKDRLLVDLKNDLSLKVTNATTDSRIDRWSTAAELIAKKPLIGYGAGSEIELLHEKFYEKRYYSSFLNKLNAHNQYLSFLLKSGIMGLLVYLGTLLYGFKKAIEKRDLLLKIFWMLIKAFFSMLYFSPSLCFLKQGFNNLLNL